MPIDDTYPDYPGNTQDESLDDPGDTTDANGEDYNVHDREILAHQDVLKAIQDGEQVYPDLRLEDGGKFYLNVEEDVYIQYNSTTNRIEFFIEGVKIGHLTVSS